MNHFATPAALRPAWGPHLRLIGMVLLWGASWPAGRVVAQHMPPLTAAALRFVLASVVLLLWLWRSGGLSALWHWPLRRWLGMAAAAATGVFAYAICFLTGLQHLEAGKAALLVTLNPVLTLLLAVVLLRERINASIALGMALATLGAMVVISHGDPAQLLQGRLGLGEWLILGCVVSWAIYTLIGRLMLAGVDALSTTTVTACMGAAMLLATSLSVEGVAGWRAAWLADTSVWLALLFLAWFATALAYAWFFDGVKALGAGAAAGYITLVPVVGVALATWLLREPFDAAMLLGGAMAVTGTVVMTRGRR